MGPPGPLDGHAVDLGGSRPALRRTQHDHGPAHPLGHAALAGRALHQLDAVQRPVESAYHGAVDLKRIVAGHVNRLVPVSP